MPDRIYGNMLVLGDDSDLLTEVPGLDLPSLEPHTYVLVDDDARECRIISEDELEESYVDNNIETFVLEDVNAFALDLIDSEYLRITYNTGAQISLLLGSVDFHGGARVDQYAKRNDIIYPIDDSGHLKLNATNTPNLVNVRKWYLEEARRVNDEHLEIADLVHRFVEAGFDPVSHLADFGG
ncbi:MAG TPA: hypothetical protein VFM05_06305 [Candidatus Saccharimonadales bacterium]|nr:hypothetical protein [Candidatus Saccharimonadales bacterium]